MSSHTTSVPDQMCIDGYIWQKDKAGGCAPPSMYNTGKKCQTCKSIKVDKITDIRKSHA